MQEENSHGAAEMSDEALKKLIVAVDGVQFYINEEGAMIVKRPEDVCFSDFFLAYGFHPSSVSRSFLSASEYLNTVTPGIVSALTEGAPDDDEALQLIEEFKGVVSGATLEEAGRISSCVEVVSSTFDIAKANFLAGIRYAIAQRDGVLGQLDISNLNVYEAESAVAEGMSLTPASVKGAH
jgi:hypothetical protein